MPRPPGDRAASPAVPLQPGTYELNQGWLFGGMYAAGSADPGYDDSAFSEVTLPHTVVPLSWGGWDPAEWEKVWIYRRHLDGSLLAGGRVFADFDGIMAGATAVVNGTPLGSHQGGYLPWSIELTGHLSDGGNVLALIVDARCLPVPPHGGPRGARAVDICSQAASTGTRPCALCRISSWPTCSPGQPTCSAPTATCRSGAWSMLPLYRPAR